MHGYLSYIKKNNFRCCCCYVFGWKEDIYRYQTECIFSLGVVMGFMAKFDCLYCVVTISSALRGRLIYTFVVYWNIELINCYKHRHTLEINVYIDQKLITLTARPYTSLYLNRKLYYQRRYTQLSCNVRLDRYSNKLSLFSISLCEKN